ncbi:MAG: hypothetical protein E7055_08640 [Lentisphaerae bacterium]|nr:hypothetical protein [Lentisphaerota bacterium]
MSFYRLFLLSVILVSAGFLPGCGYHVGSISHPQIKSVAIADVKNETYEVLAAALLRSILAERFQFDNSLKLTSMERADCIVYARVTKVSNSSISWTYNSKTDDENYRANEYQLTVTVEYLVRMPGRGKPLVPKSFAVGSSKYLFSHDPAIGRVSALKQAMLRVSDQIVSATTEAW